MALTNVVRVDNGKIIGTGFFNPTPIVLTGTLEAGETEITFTSNDILEYSMVSVFVNSDEDIAPTEKDSSVANTITLTFDEQEEDLLVGLLIFNLVTSPNG